MTTIDVRHEPLTYRQDAGASFFRDLIFGDRTPGAPERLARHAAEMRVIDEKRADRARRALADGDVEYRVEPNTAPGEGGYIAPPIWLNELFATARHATRVLADLIPARFPLPPGVSSVNLPIITSSTDAAPHADIAPVTDDGLSDAAGSCQVVTVTGQVDVPLQMLEQSPNGAHLDWALFMNLHESADEDLETQLITGTGKGATMGAHQILGVTNVASNVGVTYTDSTPTGSEMYPYFGQTAAQLANGRKRPPEVWLMRTARWGWITTSEDTQGLPFGLPSPFFMGADTQTPNPVGGLLGFPVFLDEVIPATSGAGADEDTVICLRPSDLILFEGIDRTAVMRDVLSGAMGARIQLHRPVAAITNRYPSGIAAITGTGMAVQSGF